MLAGENAAALFITFCAFGVVKGMAVNMNKLYAALSLCFVMAVQCGSGAGLGSAAVKPQCAVIEREHIRVTAADYDEAKVQFRKLIVKTPAMEKTLAVITDLYGFSLDTFSANGQEFLFIQIGRQMGVGEPTADCLILKKDTLEPVRVENDAVYMKRNFRSEIAPQEKIVRLWTSRQSLRIEVANPIAAQAIGQHPRYVSFHFSQRTRYKYECLAWGAQKTLVCKHLLSLPISCFIGYITVVYEYKPEANIFVPKEDESIKVTIFQDCQ